MDRPERGSVLMEFLVVLPVYFLLIGFVFVTGEISLHAIHLSASADRACAMSSAEDEDTVFGKVRKAISFDKDHEYEPEYSYKNDNGTTAKVSDFEHSRIERVANAEFKGAWTRSVAAYVRDNYTLTPLSRGFIAHWFFRNERKMSEAGMSDPKDSAIDTMLADGGLGRVSMEGKDLDYKGVKARMYGYYSLQRNDCGRTGYDPDRLPYRAWSAGSLADPDAAGGSAVWRSKVYDGYVGGGAHGSVADETASVKHEIVDSGELLGERAPVAPASSPAAWSRNADFVKWAD